jgi:hypothetical protein
LPTLQSSYCLVQGFFYYYFAHAMKYNSYRIVLFHLDNTSYNLFDDSLEPDI